MFRLVEFLSKLDSNFYLWLHVNNTMSTATRKQDACAKYNYRQVSNIRRILEDN